MADDGSSDCLNATEFAQPHWQVIARGFDTERWFADDQAVGTGGILMPRRVRLPPGHHYYRFASSNSSRAAQHGGGWWLEFEEYAKIERFATEHGYRLKDAARLMLALPYAWTKVDVRIKASLKHPLYAWRGEGKPVREPAGSGTTRARGRATSAPAWIPLQHVRVQQLYVPGLYVQGRAEQLHERAFLQPPERNPI